MPTATPVTIPVADPTVAFATALLLHVPPPVESLRLIVDPTHTDPGVPRIAVIGLTVTILLLLQPVVAIIYDIVQHCAIFLSNIVLVMLSPD